MAQSNSHQTSELHKKVKAKQEFRQHTVSFVMMIFLTILAFIAIASDAVSDRIAVLFIILLACVQVFFQLYVWMHMSHKGHEFPKWVLIAGGAVALITVITLIILI
jgi:cytochrome c oxidase subunit IV